MVYHSPNTRCVTDIDLVQGKGGIRMFLCCLGTGHRNLEIVREYSNTVYE